MYTPKKNGVRTSILTRCLTSASLVREHTRGIEDNKQTCCAMISEDFLSLSDYSPSSLRGLPRERSDMGMLFSSDLWGDSDLPAHTQMHLDVHDGSADSREMSQSVEDWKMGSAASLKSCSYQDVLRLGSSQEVCKSSSQPCRSGKLLGHTWFVRSVQGLSAGVELIMPGDQFLSGQVDECTLSSMFPS